MCFLGIAGECAMVPLPVEGLMPLRSACEAPAGKLCWLQGLTRDCHVACAPRADDQHHPRTACGRPLLPANKVAGDLLDLAVLARDHVLSDRHLYFHPRPFLTFLLIPCLLPLFTIPISSLLFTSFISGIFYFLSFSRKDVPN